MGGILEVGACNGKNLPSSILW